MTYLSPRRARGFLALLTFTMCASALRATPLAAQVSKAAARAAIMEANRALSKARFTSDRAAFEKTLTPDFHAEAHGERMTRQQFIEQGTTPSNGTLLRFDVGVLTVQPLEGGAWLATVQQKIELERAGPDGKAQKTYLVWIITDTWKQSGGSWVWASSMGIMSERWTTGDPPPFSDW